MDRRSLLVSVAVICLACLASTIGAGCRRVEQTRAVSISPVAVTVAPAERCDVPLVQEFAARMEAAATVEVRANVEGRLTGMSFKEGNMVEKAAILFRIDSRRYDAAVQLADAAVEKAEADLEMAREQQHLVNAQSALRQTEANLLKTDQDVARLKPLAARKAVPQRDLEAAIAAQSSTSAAVEDARATVRTTAVADRMGLRQAQANVMAAKTTLDTARLDRAETEVRAPIGGLIGRAEVSVGNYVGRGEPSRLATISQLDPIEVVFGISETLYLHTVDKIDRAALNNIELLLSDGSLYPLRGRYTNIGRAVDEKTGTLLIVARFPNPKGILLPGMTGRVRLNVGVKRNAILIPTQALFDVSGSKAVYLATPENRVELRGVVVERTYQGRSIVIKGLVERESVVVDGGLKLHAGQVLTPLAAQNGLRQ